MPSQGDLHPQSLGSVRVQQPPAPQHPWAPVLPMMAPQSLGRPPRQVSLHCMCLITFCVSSATRLLHRSNPFATMWMSFAHAVPQRHDHAAEVLTAGHLIHIVLALQNLHLQGPFAVLLPIQRCPDCTGCCAGSTAPSSNSALVSRARPWEAPGGSQYGTSTSYGGVGSSSYGGYGSGALQASTPFSLTDNSWRHPAVACFDQELTDVHTASNELQECH